MRDFFKPWRRKIGVVTLGVACVAMAGWMRNGFLDDDIEMKQDGSVIVISAFDGKLQALASWSSVEWPQLSAYDFWWGVSSSQRRSPRWTVDGAVFGARGFAFATRSDGGRHWVAISLPYWFIVLPLTLLSAWLLLWKPRHTAPKQTLEPAPTTGT